MTYVMNSTRYYCLTHNENGQVIRGKDGVIILLNRTSGLLGEIDDIRVKD